MGGDSAIGKFVTKSAANASYSSLAALAALADSSDSDSTAPLEASPSRSARLPSQPILSQPTPSPLGSIAPLEAEADVLLDSTSPLDPPPTALSANTQQGKQQGKPEGRTLVVGVGYFGGGGVRRPRFQPILGFQPLDYLPHRSTSATKV